MAESAVDSGCRELRANISRLNVEGELVMLYSDSDGYGNSSEKGYSKCDDGGSVSDCQNSTVVGEGGAGGLE
jgi:hypothetical protein